MAGQQETGLLSNSSPSPALINSPDQVQALTGGLMSPRFPAHQRRWIDPQLPGHLPLRVVKHLRAVARRSGDELVAGEGTVTQELNNSRHVTDLVDRCVAFPSSNRHFVNANLVGKLHSEEFEV